MKGISRRYILTFCCVLSLLILPGCGKKTRPVPPQSLLPDAISDLRYDLDDNSATLSWSFSGQTESGETFSKPLDFELFKAEVTAENYCPDCPVKFGRPILITVNDQTVEDNGRQLYRDSDLKAGHRYHYKIRPRLGRFSSSKESNIVSFWWLTPIAAPEKLRIVIGDNKVTLNWQQTTHLIDNTPLDESILYQVYRRLDDSIFSPLGALQTSTTYVDETVQNKVAYFYRVRAVRRYKDTMAYGASSQVITAVPKDMKPPSTPRNLAAIKTSDGVKLFWDMSEEKDLAGYRVYRREASSTRKKKIGNVAASQITFIDRDLLSGSSYYYSLTAIDKAEPPNESKATAEVLYKKTR